MTDDDASDLHRENTRGLPPLPARDPGDGRFAPIPPTGRLHHRTKGPEMKPEEAIKGLAEEARRIGHQHADQASAWERTLEAKAELLQAIIDAVKPALQAICSRVVLKKETPGGERADVVATWTGIRIAGGLGDARALYLTVGGVLMEVDYIWGGGWEWQGKWCPQTVRHTITEFDIEPMIESLTQALVAQAKGGAQKRTELLQVHAVQLQAVATLLRGIR